MSTAANYGRTTALDARFAGRPASCATRWTPASQGVPPFAQVLRLGIRVRRERAEEALAALLPLLEGGAEECEPAPGAVEFAVYGSADALPAADAVRALAGEDLVGLELRAVPAGWERRWHEHLRPVEVAAGGRRLRIRPPWVPAADDLGCAAGPEEVFAGRPVHDGVERAADPEEVFAGRLVDDGVGRAAHPAGAPFELVIDPGDSFGLGGHPTSRLCLELLLELEPGGALCDWGAGSGVLALAAARLGWAPVAAVEVEPGALAAIRGNAAANGVDVGVRALDLTAGPAPWAPTVCANLTLDLHLRVAATIERAPDRLIVAGMLAARADDVAAAYGLPETRRRVRDGWAALLLERA
jgi:ribosomal protein L11 methyltransferase